MCTSLPWWATLACLIGSCKDPSSARDHRPAADVSKYGGVYRKPLKHDPMTLDPAVLTTAHSDLVARQIFDGLVEYDGDLNVVPCIAESWQGSPDGRVWTFRIRRGVTFHNGREVRAEDVVYSFTRVLDPATNPEPPSVFGWVKGAQAFRAGDADRVVGLEALDPHTVRITLDRPYAPFISTLGMARAKIVPREAVERPGVDFGKRPVGSGPFRFGTWEAGRSIELHANEAYFAGRPFLDRLVYRIFPGAPHEAILSAFRTGELEDSSSLSGKTSEVESDARYPWLQKPQLATVLLLMNVREPPLSRVEVRQAIHHAIDRDAINAAVRRRFKKATGVLPVGMPGYDPDLATYDHDVDRARELLASAGFPGGEGLPTLTLWSSVNAPMVVTEHEMIARDLAAVGIDLELAYADSWRDYKQTVLGKRPRSIYRMAWYADYPDPDHFLFMLFHSQGGSNHSNYHQPEIDRLIERARREMDYLERVALYRRAEARIVADAPSINLVYPVFQEMAQPYVRGIELNALGESYVLMKTVWLDRADPSYPRAGAEPAGPIERRREGVAGWR